MAKRNTAELKEQLILAGIESIHLYGINQLSLRTIAKSCGVTHGTPYKHFNSKDGYLHIVLQRLSSIWGEMLMKNVIETTSAKEQLIQMGINFITSAQAFPNYFEALFVKFPFKDMQVTSGTINTSTDFPGFTHFKNVVLKLRKEESFTNDEVETLIHLWSFISGLALLVTSHIGDDLSDENIRTLIVHMIDNYIKGEKS